MTLERDSLLKDRYRILAILGQGGMGAVYHARDENLGVEVAVKENLFTSDEYSRQFRREAVILATMRHPNLPRVFDHFEVEDYGQYMVMDYIEGEDLRQRMDRVSSLPEEEVIIIGAAICDALQYLHTREPAILHRDIKPGNIKINPTGQVYLVDFGLAKIMQGSQVTTTGARAMTPGYSSPEQYGTARTDERSDIYSLGATLYAALTNTIPEDGLARAMEQADLTPVRKRNSRISRRLALTIEKALAVHPEDRFQTAEEFKFTMLQASNSTKQLEHTEELTVSPPPPEVIAEIAAGKRVKTPGAKEPERQGTSSTRMRRIRRERVRRRLMVFFFVLLTAFGIWLGLGRPGESYLTSMIPPEWLPAISQQDHTATPTTAPPTPTSVVSLVVSTAMITPSPTAPPSTLTPTLIPLPGVPTATLAPLDYEAPFVSEQIAFASLRSGTLQIWLYSFADDSVEQITDMDYGACQPSWSPDGRRLAFISPCTHNNRIYTDTYLFVLDMETSEIIQLNVEQGSFDPAWSPDGNSLLFTKAENLRNSAIYRLSLVTGETELMSQDVRLTFNPEWSPDGQQIVFSSNRSSQYHLYIMPNEPEAAPEEFAHTDDKVYVKPAWSVRGTIVYSRSTLDSFPSMLEMPASMLGASEFLYKESSVNADSLSVPELDPDFNSTGNWLAYESWPDGANRDIYIMREDGHVVIRITEYSKDDFDPAWRPIPENQN